MKWGTEKVVLAVLVATVGMGLSDTSLEVNAGNKVCDYVDEKDSVNADGKNGEYSYVVVKDGKSYHSNKEEFVKFYMEQEELWDTEEVFYENGEEMAEPENVSENQCGDSLYWELSEDGVMTISGTGKMWDFRNDAEYFDYHECPWREQKEKIKSVVFEEGITYTGADAFAECKSLTKVKFCDTLIYIGPFSFYLCENLENFVLPDSLTAIGQQAFEGSVKLTSVKIPDNVTFLDAGVFRDNTYLKEVYIGGNKDAGGYTYSNDLFRYCTALEKFEVSEENLAFCSVDGALYTTRDTMWENYPIGSVFLLQYPCGKRDKQCRLADKTVGLNPGSIEGVQYIEEICISETVQEIGAGSICSCPKLKSLTIPSNVKSIIGSVGDYCESLEYIKNESEVELSTMGYVFSKYDANKRYQYWKDAETNQIIEKLGKGMAIPVYFGDVMFMNECFEVDGITYQMNTLKQGMGLPLTAEEINFGKAYGSVLVKNVPKEKVDSFVAPSIIEYLGWKYEVEPYTPALPTVTQIPTATQKPTVTKAPIVPTNMPESYKINYILNKGKNNQSNPDSYTTKNIKLKAPKRKGYTFEGWYTEKNFTNPIKTIKADTKQDITVYAKWTKVKKLSKPTIKSAVNVKGEKIKVTLKKKVAGTKGYEISYSTDKKWKKSVKTVTSNGITKTITKLKKNKTYYVKVRAYKLDSAGEKVYGSYSKVKKIKIQK